MDKGTTHATCCAKPSLPLTMSPHSIFLLAALALIAGADATLKCKGGRSSCPPYKTVHTLLPNAELRRYDGGVWVARSAPPDTFTYTCEYSSFYLGDYFRGLNYEDKVFNSSTPLVISMNVWDMKAPRLARFFVQETSKGRVAPPYFPATLVTEPERWYYVREVEQTMDFSTIMYTTFKMMADLVLERQPFNQKKIHVAMYNYPKGGKPYTGKNEIWIEKETIVKPPYNDMEEEYHTMTAEELMAVADSWLHMEKEPESVFDPATGKIEYIQK